MKGLSEEATKKLKILQREISEIDSHRTATCDPIWNEKRRQELKIQIRKLIRSEMHKGNRYGKRSKENTV